MIYPCIYTQLAENPEWKGNYKVQYWNADWKSIIFGNDNSYTKKLLNSHFDGAYLDIIDKTTPSWKSIYQYLCLALVKVVP